MSQFQPEPQPSVANIIMAQLGNNRFLAMTGARNLIGGPKTLGMTLPSKMTKGRATHCCIRLEDDDTYTVETFKLRKISDPDQTIKIIDSAELVYAEQLQSTFTRLTGLDTHL